jgi:Na+-translocating ferredoxin:NAD+ oxidoreductase RnfD subunit
MKAITSTLDQFLPTLHFYPNRNPRLRFFALWYFTILLILWTIAGHTVLGFEQAWIHPFVGVAAAMVSQFFLEWVDATARGRKTRFSGCVVNLINFLPPAIIPGLACAMLIYPNARIAPVMLAAVLSIASKVIFRAPVGNGQTQHVFNPSNIGITLTLLLMPSVGLAPPYQFTENVTGAGHWILPAVILLSGIYMHGKFTGRLPLVLAWLGAFAAQGLLRAAIFGIPWRVPFIPMTSAAFILFTLYMIPDPATTPIKPSRQVLFGIAIAAIYGALFVLHVVFGLFIALASVCAVRGIALHVSSALASRSGAPRHDVVVAMAAR